MHRVTVKTSTIFIAKGGRTRVYRSVSEIPQGLRKELEASTNGFNSATILIADRRGRKEILRALQGLPSALRTRLAASFAPAQEESPGRAAIGSLSAAELAGAAAARRRGIAAVGGFELAIR
jgi:hypothetical protein